MLVHFMPSPSILKSTSYFFFGPGGVRSIILLLTEVSVANWILSLAFLDESPQINNVGAEILHAMSNSCPALSSVRDVLSKSRCALDSILFYPSYLKHLCSKPRVVPSSTMPQFSGFDWVSLRLRLQFSNCDGVSLQLKPRRCYVQHK